MKKKIASHNLGTYPELHAGRQLNPLSTDCVYVLGIMPTSCGVVQSEAVVTFCLYHRLADGYLGFVQPFDLVARVL